MNKTPMIRRIIRLSVGLLIAGVVYAQVTFGQDIALGVMGGGLVMFLSFVGGGWAAHRVGQSAEQGFQRGAAALVILKLPMLFGALWMLFQRFDAIAVVVGGSVVMLSIVLSAVFEMANPIRKEA